MIRPSGFQLCLLEKSKPLPCCLQAAEGEPPRFAHLHCSCVLLLQPRTAVTQGLSQAGTTGDPCQAWACLGVCTGKQVLLLRMGFYLNGLLNLILIFLKTGYVTLMKNRHKQRGLPTTHLNKKLFALQSEIIVKRKMEKLFQYLQKEIDNLIVHWLERFHRSFSVCFPSVVLSAHS